MLPNTSVGEATTVAVVGVGRPVEEDAWLDIALVELGAAAAEVCWPSTRDATPPAMT